MPQNTHVDHYSSPDWTVSAEAQMIEQRKKLDAARVPPEVTAAEVDETADTGKWLGESALAWPAKAWGHIKDVGVWVTACAVCITVCAMLGGAFGALVGGFVLAYRLVVGIYAG